MFAAAGGDTGRDIASGGQAISQGGSEIVMRSLLSERRSQESAADQAGLKYLDATQQSGRGMLETFERFAQQEYVSATYQDPFVRSHPVAASGAMCAYAPSTPGPKFVVGYSSASGRAAKTGSHPSR